MTDPSRPPEKTARPAGAAGPPARAFARKMGIAAAGGIVTAAGVVMLVTPGPGILVTIAGLGILSREFPSAGRPLQRLRQWRDQRAEKRTS